MTTMRGEGSRLWMRSRHGREGRKHTADAQPGRDERLLDIARETLQ